MKKMNVAVIFVIAVFFFGAASAAAYSGSDSPVAVLSDLTGKSADSLAERKMSTGKSFGEIASEEGKLIEFRHEMLKMKKNLVVKQAETGAVSEKEACDIIANIKRCKGCCDGKGSYRLKRKCGVGFGVMKGQRCHGKEVCRD